MPKYMVIVLTEEGETFANFFEDVRRAEQFRMDSEVCMGEYAEVYERIETEHGREYQLIYC